MEKSIYYILFWGAGCVLKWVNWSSPSVPTGELFQGPSAVCPPAWHQGGGGCPVPPGGWEHCEDYVD